MGFFLSFGKVNLSPNYLVYDKLLNVRLQSGKDFKLKRHSEVGHILTSGVATNITHVL